MVISNLHLPLGIFIARETSIPEKAQRHASKISIKLKDLLYEEILKIWGITSLEKWKTRVDLIQTYKTVNGLEFIDSYSGLQFLSGSSTRAATSHSKRLKREVFPSKVCNDFFHFVNVRHEYFLNGVMGNWNELTNSHVNDKKKTVLRLVLIYIGCQRLSSSIIKQPPYNYCYYYYLFKCKDF